MTVKLNHTIVHARDKRASADFYCEVFGFPRPKAFGPFLGVETPNEVTLDFLDTGGSAASRRLATRAMKRAAPVVPQP